MTTAAFTLSCQSELSQSLPLFQRYHCLSITQLGSRVSDILKLCLTTWSRLIDAKLYELVSDTRKQCASRVRCLHTSVDIGGSISSFAIGFSPSPWPGTASSTLLHLSIPPGNLAAQEAGTLRIKPRVGIFFVDFSCGILAVAFGCAVLLFTSDAQLELTFFGRSRVAVLYLLLGVLLCALHK